MVQNQLTLKHWWECRSIANQLFELRPLITLRLKEQQQQTFWWFREDIRGAEESWRIWASSDVERKLNSSSDNRNAAPEEILTSRLWALKWNPHWFSRMSDHYLESRWALKCLRGPVTVASDMKHCLRLNIIEWRVEPVSNAAFSVSEIFELENRGWAYWSRNSNLSLISAW